MSHKKRESSSKRSSRSESDLAAASEEDTSEYSSPLPSTAEEEETVAYWKQRCLTAERRVAELEAKLAFVDDNADESESEGTRPSSSSSSSKRRPGHSSSSHSSRKASSARLSNPTPAVLASASAAASPSPSTSTPPSTTSTATSVSSVSSPSVAQLFSQLNAQSHAVAVAAPKRGSERSLPEAPTPMMLVEEVASKSVMRVLVAGLAGSVPSKSLEVSPPFMLGKSLIQLVSPLSGDVSDVRSHLTASHALLLCYDASRDGAANALAQWHAMNFAEVSLPTVCVGTRGDEASAQRDEAQELAEALFSSHFLVSSRSGSNVSESLSELVSRVASDAPRVEPLPVALEALPTLRKLYDQKAKSAHTRSLSVAESDQLTTSTPLPMAPEPAPVVSAEDLDENDLSIDKGVIRYASFERLVDRVVTDTLGLATWDPSDLLNTYSIFSTSRQLFDALSSRYKSTDRDSVKQKVLSVILSWLNDFYPQFSSDATVADDLLAFCEQFGALEVKKAYYAKKNVIADSSRIYTKPILPESQSLPILEWDPLEVARQITLIDWEQFKLLSHTELVGLPWTKSRKDELAPHVVALTKQFNAISGWACTIICTTERLKDRVRVMKKFVTIADKLKSIGNFNSMMAIMSGLDRSPIYRMKETMSSFFAERKYAQAYEEIKMTADSRGSYANLRQAIKQRPPPSIPYLGMILTDFTFIDEGNKEAKDRTGLVNCTKMRLMADQFRMIRQCQKLDYLYAPLPALRELLADLVSLDEDTLYELSTYLEPREGQQQGPRPQALDDLLSVVAPSETSNRKKVEMRRRQSLGNLRSRSTMVINASTVASLQAAASNANGAAEEEDASEEASVEESFFPKSEEICDKILAQSFEEHLAEHRETYQFFHLFLERTEQSTANIEFYKSVVELWRPATDQVSKDTLCRNLFLQYISSMAPKKVLVSDMTATAVKECVKSHVFMPDPFEAVLLEIMPVILSAWERFREAIRARSGPKPMTPAAAVAALSVRRHSHSAGMSTSTPIISPAATATSTSATSSPTLPHASSSTGSSASPSTPSSSAATPPVTSNSKKEATPTGRVSKSFNRLSTVFSKSVKDLMNTDVTLKGDKPDKGDKAEKGEKNDKGEKGDKATEKPAEKTNEKTIEKPTEKLTNNEKPMAGEKPTPPAKPLPPPRLSSGNIAAKHALPTPPTSSMVAPTVTTPSAAASSALASETAPSAASATPNSLSAPKFGRPASGVPAPVPPKSLVWIGAEGVGRHSLVKRLLGQGLDSPNPNLHTVSALLNFNGIPCEFTVPEVNLEKTRFEELPKPERFEGVVLVYSVTSLASLTAVLKWWEMCGRSSVPAIVVGNKSDEDADSKKGAPLSKVLPLVERFDLKVFEVSAKSELNVRAAVQSLVESLMLRKILAKQGAPLATPAAATLAVSPQGDESSFVILVVGLSGSGRSSLLRRVLERSFAPSGPGLAGASASAGAGGDGASGAAVTLERSGVLRVNGLKVQFVTPPSDVERVDDLAGLDKAAGVLLVYDLTDADSFSNLVYWYSAGQRVRTLPTVMVGTRIDEVARRKVQLDRAVQWGAQHGVKVFEVSAKLGLYCQLAVEYLIELVRTASLR